MKDETDTVSYGSTGYHTLEDEAAERWEHRQWLRRRMLAGIRGHLRERRGLRWWLAFAMIVCSVVAWSVATGLHSTGWFRWHWLPAWGVIASWPVYVAALRFRAAREARELMHVTRDWHMLKASDDGGEIADNLTEEHMGNALRQAWNASQSGRGDGALPGFVFLSIITVGTYLVWDALRSGPAIVAEITMDGEIVPANPSLSLRIPSEPWYKTALQYTGLHFIAAAGIVTVAEFVLRLTIARYSPMR